MNNKKRWIIMFFTPMFHGSDYVPHIVEHIMTQQLNAITWIWYLYDGESSLVDCFSCYKFYGTEEDGERVKDELIWSVQIDFFSISQKSIREEYTEVNEDELLYSKMANIIDSSTNHNTTKTHRVSKKDIINYWEKYYKKWSWIMSRGDIFCDSSLNNNSVLDCNRLNSTTMELSWSKYILIAQTLLEPYDWIKYTCIETYINTYYQWYVNYHWWYYYRKAYMRYFQGYIWLIIPQRQHIEYDKILLESVRSNLMDVQRVDRMYDSMKLSLLMGKIIDVANIITIFKSIEDSDIEKFFSL